MALNLCDANVNTVRNLLDTPTQTVTELKAAFDGGSQNIKDWLNNVHIPELESTKQDKLTNTSNNRVLITDSNGNITESEVSVDDMSALLEDSAEMQEQISTMQSKITYGTTSPTGGNNGDIYIQYSEA